MVSLCAFSSIPEQITSVESFELLLKASPTFWVYDFSFCDGSGISTSHELQSGFRDKPGAVRKMRQSRSCP